MSRKLAISLTVALGIVAGMVSFPVAAQAGFTIGDTYIGTIIGPHIASNNHDFYCANGIQGVGTEGDNIGAIDHITVKCSDTDAWLPWVGSDSEGLQTKTQYINCLEKTGSADSRVIGLKVIVNSLQKKGIYSVKVTCSDNETYEMAYHPGGYVVGVTTSDECPSGTALNSLSVNWGNGFESSGGISSLQFMCDLRNGQGIS